MIGLIIACVLAVGFIASISLSMIKSPIVYKCFEILGFLGLCHGCLLLFGGVAFFLLNKCFGVMWFSSEGSLWLALGGVCMLAIVFVGSIGMREHT